MTVRKMKSYITTTYGMAGYFAVQIWWNDENPRCGFWEPYDTGLGRFTTEAEAAEEGREWAYSERIDFVPAGSSLKTEDEDE